MCVTQSCMCPGELLFKSTHMQVSKLNCVRHDSVNGMTFFCMLCARGIMMESDTHYYYDSDTHYIHIINVMESVTK